MASFSSRGFSQVGQRSRRLADARAAGQPAQPPPPAEDVLINPVFLSRPPRILVPPRSWASERFGSLIPWVSRETRQQRRLAGMLGRLMASVAPRTVWSMEQGDWLFRRRRRRSDPVTPFRITHPYQLADQIREMIGGSYPNLSEYRAIEVLIAMILREYSRGISLQSEAIFSFENASRDHGLAAYAVERQLPLMLDGSERRAAIQTVYEHYYHMVSYYRFSIISREHLRNDGTMFTMYCRAVFFIGRLGGEGWLWDQVDRQLLPRRREVLFLVVRDRALRRRYQRDPEYAARLKELVRYFPTE